MNNNTEYIGGIPLQVLQDVGEGEFTGKNSLRPLSYETTDRSIKIFDKENNKQHFEIGVDEDGFLKIDVYTKSADNPSTKHPDLYARQLILKSIEIFRLRGIPINGVIGQWFLRGRLAGDNTKEYLQNLQNGMTEEQAALHTWTGRLATELGFNQVESIRVAMADAHGAPFTLEIKFGGNQE